MAETSISYFNPHMWYLGQYPAVEVPFTITSDAGLTFDVVSIQYEYASASGVWHNATLHSSTPGTGMEGKTYGNPIILYWDAKAQIPDTPSTSVRMRINLEDNNDVQTGYTVSEFFNVKTSKPTVSFSFEESYTKEMENVLPVVFSADVKYYRASENADMSGASWIEYEGGDISYTFATSEETTKTVYVQVRDEFYNVNATPNPYSSIVYHNTAPTNAYVRINGSVPGNYVYTGISIDPDTGAFTVDRSITLDLYAEDRYDMTIFVDGDVEDGENIREWIPYTTSVAAVLADTENDYDATVEVTFRDIAGKETVVSKTIRLNTKIFTMAHKPLKEPSAEYEHQVYELSSGGSPLLLSKSIALTETYVRRWNEIFYPATHDYPRNTNGTINESACISMNGVSNSSNDAVQISGGQVYYDSQGRPVTVDWTTEGTKNYSNMESSYWLPPDPEDPDGVGVGLKYWIIDNTGYGDIQLEFEHFYLNPNSFGLPLNRMTPHVGDVLTVYDASAEGATEERLGPTGDRSYVLLDATKLVELYSFTGSGNQVMDLVSGYSMNANVSGGFTTNAIRGIPRLCMVLYSDAGITDSGFKLKAGPRHSTTFYNYDVDERNGELWMHQYPTGRSSDDDAVQMIYDYYESDVTIDHDAGTATFAEDPGEGAVVTADYTHYVKDEDKEEDDYSRQFLMFEDDLVDYLEPAVYVIPSGQRVNKSEVYLHGYPSSPHPSGLVTANYTVDKDRGIVEFMDGTSEYDDEFAYVPAGRISADYFRHTFKRLSNDGYGILNFKDSTIVADVTPLYPDYTWVDVKLVNEGDAILENGKIKFLARGYDNNSDGIIDQVLDVNRPWDTQKGTSAETYDKVAMQVSQNYSFSLRPSKSEAISILSTWKNASFGFNVYPRTSFYGRVVWVLGGPGGSSYPPTTVGKKYFSSEIEGSYYSIES